MFGIFISNSYSEIISLNWNFRFEKFQRVIMSWSSRMLDTVSLRVEVLRTFALSRIYYVASILPLRKTMIKKFEAAIGKFIWKGRILRVALEELKNDYACGGLKLPCLETMNRSLLSSQCLRLLKSGDIKSIAHIDYWMGPILEDIVPTLGKGDVARDIPEYYMFMGECIAALRMSELLSASSFDRLTNRIIYKDLGDFPVPVIATNSACNYELTWRRLTLVRSMLSLHEFDCMFLLVHNKLPVPERLHRIGKRNTSDCLLCPGTVSDICHHFCSCLKTRGIWSWVKQIIGQLCDIRYCTEWDILNLLFPKNRNEKKIVWILSSYVAYVWEHSSSAGELSFEKFFGFLTFKYRDTGLSMVGRVDTLH